MSVCQITLAFITLWVCVSSTQDLDDAQADPNAANFWGGNGRFGFDLLQAIEPIVQCSDEANSSGTNGYEYQNIVISPLSISSALGLMYAASPTNSTTSKQMAQTLHYPSHIAPRELAQHIIQQQHHLCSSNKDVQIANRVYVNQKYQINDNIVDLLGEDYFESMDFAQNEIATREINAWIAKQTRDKIQNSISPDAVNELTFAVIVNAIYMNLKWKFTFDGSKNVNSVFWTDYKKSGMLNKNVTLMILSQSIFDLKLYETAHFRFLKIPFTEDYNTLDKNSYSMLIALPISNSSLTYTQFNQAAQLLSNQNSAMYSAHLQSKYPNINKYVEYKVKLFLPKMTVETDTYKLKDIFTFLGMSDPFDELLANFKDFKRLNTESDGNLYLDEVYHQTFFAMNEEGVEAAGVTGVFFAANSLYKEIPFRVDHPFYFSILAEEMVNQETDQKMLFLGKVNCIGQVKCHEIK